MSSGIPGAVHAALQSMIDARVRTLLVLAENHIIGLITSYDLEGPKPLQFLNGSDCIHPKCQHEDIEVAGIMIPVRPCRPCGLKMSEKLG